MYYFTIKNFKFEIKQDNENQITISCQNNESSKVFETIVTEEQVKMKLNLFIKYLIKCINLEFNYTFNFEDKITSIVLDTSANLDGLYTLKHTLVFTEKKNLEIIKFDFEKKLSKIEEEYKNNISEIKEMYNELLLFPKKLWNMEDNINTLEEKTTELSKELSRTDGKFEIMYYMYKAQEKEFFITKINKYLEYFKPIYKNCFNSFLDKVNENSYKGVFTEISWKYARHCDNFRDKPEPNTIILNSIDELHNYGTPIQRQVQGNYIISDNLLRHFKQHITTNIEIIHNYNNEIKVTNG